MKNSIHRIASTFLPASVLSASVLAASVLPMAACSSPPTAPNVTEESEVIETENGKMVVATTTLTATVKAIDASARKLTLMTSNGYKTQVTVGPAAINFEQIQVGDQVNVKATEEFAVFLRPTGTPASAGAAGVVALAPKGEMPSGIVAGTFEVTARITEIDTAERDVTLQFVDGSTRTLRVGPDVDLARASVGDDVTVHVAEAVAITVTRP